MAAKLHTYRAKRNFRQTPEPRGAKGRRADTGPVFVIQKHDATALHFDLRLEVDGVLKSWAVPKGPSFDPEVKRLAVQTEDHPMEYAQFEGLIPPGEYGGGTMMIWDRGTWEQLDERKPAKAIRDGHFKFRLNGERIQGAFALTRVGEGPKPRWLLVKMRDADASPRRNPVNTQKKSVATGRTMKQIDDDG